MSASVSLHVSTTDPTPAYEQLRRQLVELIHSGQLGPDERLPPVRQLASDLGLAVGTVARTYRELEAEGLVVTRRGGGTRVRADTIRRSADEQRQALREHAAAFVRLARLLGADDHQVDAAIREALASLPRSPDR